MTVPVPVPTPATVAQRREETRAQARAYLQDRDPHMRQLARDLLRAIDEREAQDRAEQARQS